MKSTVKIVLSLVLFPIFFSSPSFAKDLTRRIGVGYNAQFNQSTATDGIPAISIKYGVAPRAVIDLIGGISTATPSSSVAAIKYMYTLFPETYANFYGLVAAGIVSAQNRSGAEFLGGFGAEFFIPGVDSVGISFETGVAAENAATGSFVLKTFGVSFINAGMHFYF